VIVLEQDEETLRKRHVARQDTQSEKFLKGRKTKIQNILDAKDLPIEKWKLDEINDTVRLSNNIWSWLTADIR
tara:strand:- start:266 stop:484 length:219 start_codon:yes stop_codon:yes gene_type:complete